MGCCGPIAGKRAMGVSDMTKRPSNGIVREGVSGYTKLDLICIEQHYM